MAQLSAEMQAGTGAAAEVDVSTLEQVRAATAALLGVAPSHVALGNTTSQFWIAALSQLPITGRRLLIAPHEWGTHVQYLQHIAQDRGLTLDVIPEVDALNPAAWAARIDSDVAAMILPHVTSVQGLIYPVAEIGALARPDTTLLVVDGAQAAGRVPMTVPGLNCDVLVATARKWLRGPRTTSMMAFSPRAQALLGLAKRFEPVDVNLALRLGMGAAMDQALEEGVEAMAAELTKISMTFRTILGQHAELAAWMAAGRSSAKTAPGHITMAIPAERRPALDARLAAAKITVKWAIPADEEPLSAAAHDHTIARLRITPHRYNKSLEAQALGAALAG